jgi:mono/diheme cytochrome c family protein
MKRELAAIMSPLGLKFEWRSMDVPREHEVFRDLAVVTFRGSCECELPELLSRHGEEGPLGWTHVTDGEILPFSEVDCDGIRALIGPALLRLDPRQRMEAYGRAIARVLSHELYHVFTRTSHHGSSGVAQPAHGVRELMANEFNFGEGDARLLGAMAAGNRSLRALVETGRVLYTQSGCATCHGSRGRGTVRAPSLRSLRKSFNVAGLSARLAGKVSKMYRAARQAKIALPTLAKSDVESIVTYLNSAID